MAKATFDPARELTLYFRCNRTGSKDFVFVYSDGSSYSLIYEDIEFNIYENEGDKIKLLQLSTAFAANTVTASITNSQSNINEGEYYFEMYRPNIDKTWVTGYAIFHNGKFDGITETSTITINENGEAVTITIQESGITQSELDAALALKADLNTRVRSTTSTATLTPNVSLYDMDVITAQAEALVIANPEGTPSNGDGFMIDVTDNGTARAITYGNKYVGYAEVLPSTTILGKGIKLVFQYSSVTDTYDLLNVINEL